MQNDGSELAELFQVNVSEIARTKALNGDLGNQLRSTFALLAEARDLLEITALESPLRKDILDLIEKIDEFYPQGE